MYSIHSTQCTFTLYRDEGFTSLLQQMTMYRGFGCDIQMCKVLRYEWLTSLVHNPARTVPLIHCTQFRIQIHTLSLQYLVPYHRHLLKPR